MIAHTPTTALLPVALPRHGPASEEGREGLKAGDGLAVEEL